MIVIETPTGTHRFNNTAEVKNNGGTLKIYENNTVIAAFREWTNWRTETPQEGTEK